jgi:hypothetical protein
LNHFYPGIQYKSIPVIKSKESRLDGPRPDERNLWDDPDYFRHQGDIDDLRLDDRFLVGYCRGFRQAIDLRKISKSESNLILIEVYHTLGIQLHSCDHLKDFEIDSIFLTPISKQEIQDLKEAGVRIKDYVTSIMQHKQLIRARFYSKKLNDRLLSDIASRAKDTYSELQSASQYGHVIVNHDGEGSANWHRFPNGDFYKKPEGDAGRTVELLHRILCNVEENRAEHWEEFLV